MVKSCGVQFIFNLFSGALAQVLRLMTGWGLSDLHTILFLIWITTHKVWHSCYIFPSFFSHFNFHSIPFMLIIFLSYITYYSYLFLFLILKLSLISYYRIVHYFHSVLLYLHFLTRLDWLEFNCGLERRAEPPWKRLWRPHCV